VEREILLVYEHLEDAVVPITSAGATEENEVSQPKDIHFSLHL